MLVIKSSLSLWEAPSCLQTTSNHLISFHIYIFTLFFLTKLTIFLVTETILSEIYTTHYQVTPQAACPNAFNFQKNPRQNASESRSKPDRTTATKRTYPTCCSTAAPDSKSESNPSTKMWQETLTEVIPSKTSKNVSNQPKTPVLRSSPISCPISPTWASKETQKVRESSLKTQTLDQMDLNCTLLWSSEALGSTSCGELGNTKTTTLTPQSRSWPNFWLQSLHGPEY